MLFGKNTAVDGDFASDIATSSLTGTTGFQISGTNGGDGLGFSVAMGDFNGDGIEDMLIGANYGGGYTGARLRHLRTQWQSGREHRCHQPGRGQRLHHHRRPFGYGGLGASG